MIFPKNSAFLNSVFSSPTHVEQQLDNLQTAVGAGQVERVDPVPVALVDVPAGLHQVGHDVDVAGLDPHQQGGVAVHVLLPQHLGLNSMWGKGVLRGFLKKKIITFLSSSLPKTCFAAKVSISTCLKERKNIGTSMETKLLRKSNL